VRLPISGVRTPTTPTTVHGALVSGSAAVAPDGR
jgi:hypothetical protein